MGPYSVDNNASTPEESSPGRSFLSRLGLSPFRPRTRNITDFHIRPQEPYRKYGAGDHVRGAVILTILKPIRISHLTVSLYGFARVFKSANAANEAAPSPAVASAGSKGPQYSGNGIAPLFQDEQVLSGDGRLEPGKYEFNFDLVFPPGGLPSSIDFERGTISYMINATLTRPTSIATTTSCDRKVMLLEKVDVGLLPPPRERTIYVEPISKKSRRKRAVPAEKSGGSASSDAPEPASDLDSIRATENSGDSSVNFEETAPEFVSNTPRSPVHSDMRSEISADSAVSNSTGPSGRTGVADANHLVGMQPAPGKLPLADDRTITATIELTRGGCLPGDIVPVKISVQHIKRIRSMHGVIITFYRQGRIDSSPPITSLASVSAEDTRKLEKEEYYPRSKTGLGGLSLSSAGSCSMFRKDLSQSISPLIIDPVTLTANIHASVRVPEDVFPTIKGVPGEIISFRYQLEVIVDLGGKLASQILAGAQVNRPPGVSGGTTAGSPYDAAYSGQISAWGGKMIDTDHLRREKGVVSVVFEVVVGTEDSMRSRGKTAVRPTPLVLSQRMYDSSPVQEGGQPGGWGNGYHDEEAEETAYGPNPQPQAYVPSSPTRFTYPVSGQPSAPHYIPSPQLPNESAMTEKERLRVAEERLLPSQPPAFDAAGSASATAPPPPPPVGPAVVRSTVSENIYDAEDETPVSNGHHSVEPPLPPLPPHAEEAAAPDLDTARAPPAAIVASATATHEAAHEAAQAPRDIADPHAATAPTLAELSEAAANHPTDDKQELERQRLLAEASAPPDFPEDYDDATVVAGPSALLPPMPGPSSSAAAAAAVPTPHPPMFPPPPPLTDRLAPSAPPAAVVDSDDPHQPSAPYLPRDEDDQYGHQYSYRDASVVGPPSSSTLNQHARPAEQLPRYEQ